MATKCTQFEQKSTDTYFQAYHTLSGRSSQLESGDISIRHFQYGGVCLHCTRASFNTIFGM